MALHPQAQQAIESAAAEPGPRIFEPGFDIAGSRAAERTAAEAGPHEPVDRVDDVDADGVPVRVFRPSGWSPGAGVVVHLHGGGFVFHDVVVHDAPCRRLANRSGMVVISVDYRRPPEHRFPAAPDDVDTVIGWLHRQGDLAGPWWVHGDSAGGNLALVACLRNPGTFAGQVLIYPFLDPSAGFDSYRTAADGFDPREAAWYWQQYAADPSDLTDPDLAPLLSDRLSSAPPTLLVTAEHDPLRDEGELLATRLAELGVPVVATRYLGQIHGFWRHDQAFDASEALMRQVAGWLDWQRAR